MSESTTTVTAPAHAIDARGSLPSRDELRQALRQAGFLHFRGLLAPEFVRYLAADIRRILNDGGWLPGQASETSITAKAGRQEGSEGWWACYTQVQALERFHRLAFALRLREIRDALFTTSFVHTRKIANLVYPSFAVLPHQDHPAVQGAVDTLTFWVPLITGTRDAGVLRVLVGSHLGGVLPMRPLADAGATLTVVPNLDWHEVKYVAGDVVVLHSLTVHELTRNGTADVALSCDYRVQDAREPACVASLLPHHFPRVPSARTLSRGWSTRRWINTPMLTRKARFLMPRSIEEWHEALAATESRFAE